MFQKEQRIVGYDRISDLFPGAKRTLIKRERSSRRREERDTIQNILKDPGAVMDDFLLPEQGRFIFDERTDSIDTIRAWFEGEMDGLVRRAEPMIDDERSFMAETFGGYNDFVDDNFYCECECRWCQGYNED